MKSLARLAILLAGLPMADRAPKRHQEGTAVYDAFYDRVTFDIPLELSGVAAGEKVPAVLEFGYQACTESSCDLPATESLKIELVAEAAVVARGAPPAAGPGTSNVDRALAGAALAARFEGDRVQPGKPAVLLVELPAGLLAEGSTVPKADLLLPEDVLPAGDALVLAGGTLRVPVEID